MDFTHSDDRRMLADTLRRFIDQNAGPFVRADAARTAPGYNVALWTRFAELGVIGALFPPGQGGFGGAGFDIMVVFEALGRGLVPEPFLSSLMAGSVLAGADGNEPILDSIIAGADRVAFAHDEIDAGYDLTHVATRADRIGDEWILDGAKTVVRDAEGATSLIVSARTSGGIGDVEGISVFLVPADADGLKIQGYPCVDGGRAAEVILHQVRLPETALLGPVGEGSIAIENAVGVGILALCAEAIGAMEVVRDATLDYLRTREQFGEPIGRNQALQHRMASLLIEIEQAHSAVINAAAAMEERGTARDQALSAAKYTIGKTGTLVAEEAIQLHGGIGMTWELPMSHFAKRLIMINHQLGDDDHHLARYAKLARAA